MTNINKIKLSVIIASLSLAGCASKGESRARANDKIDWSKVQHVDAVALDSGVKVIWVNPPYKKPKKPSK
jgi:outer membrane murein-binding lipoprotein Lpp